MTQFKVTNITTNAVEVLDSVKGITKFIASETNSSLKSVEKEVKKAMKDATTVFETFSIEEIKEEETMTTETTVETTEEIVTETPAVETAETTENAPVAETEIPEFDAEPAQTDEKVETPATPENEVTDEKANADEQSTENPAPAAETEEEKPSKRRIGKTLIAYENGVEVGRFPSIKACAEHFKQVMNLGHMPFTPIMKSVRQNIDWNAYSFAFENEADLHIPESLKKKIAESQAKAAQSAKPAENPATENAETPATETPETIEEIVEVPAEELA